MYRINSHTIFSPKLKSNFIYLGNFSSIWQEFLPFLVGWITLYIYALRFYGFLLVECYCGAVGVVYFYKDV